MRTALKTSRPRAFLTTFAVAALTVTALGQERDRAKIPDQYKWNMADIYPSDTAWRAAKDRLTVDVPQLLQFQGKLNSTPGSLADARENDTTHDTEMSTIYV